MSVKASWIREMEIEVASSVKNKNQGWKYASSLEAQTHYVKRLPLMTWMGTTTKIIQDLKVKTMFSCFHWNFYFWEGTQC